MDLQEYFFLVFFSNPRTGRVRVFPDGEKTSMHLSSETFLKLVEDTAGLSALPDIRDALNTYGTPWLFNRSTSSVIRLSAGTSDQKGIIESMVAKLEKESNPARTTINPAERYANAETASYIIEDDDRTGTTISIKAPEIRIK